MAHLRFAPLLALLLLACSAAAFVFLSRGSDAAFAYFKNGRVDPLAAQAYFSDLIAFSGPEAASAEFLREGAQLAAPQAHDLAHAFGGALYEREGVEGFRYCTDAFTYGCYHQFSGIAIAEQGEAVVLQLRDACRSLERNAVFGCLHGIGHGLLAFEGYSPEALRHVLDACASLDPAHGRNGCSDGAFMEYNLRIMTATDTPAIPRAFKESNALSLCSEVSERDKAACYFELPDWWAAAMAEPESIEARAARTGELCRSTPGYERACFEGAGFLLPTITQYDAARVRALCGAMASDEAEALSCLSGAARRYRSAKRPELEGICAAFGLGAAERSYCETYAHTTPERDATLTFPIAAK